MPMNSASMTVIMKTVISDEPCAALRPAAPRLLSGSTSPLVTLEHRVHAGFNAAGKVAGAKPRCDHLVNDSVGDGIRQHAFEAVPYFDAQSTIIAHD